MHIQYPKIGICGLSCHLCPLHHTPTQSKCHGCKSTSRMAVGCPFITCAVKKKEIEFCWECPDNKTCEKWRKHREYSNTVDSFKCYQTLENDIAYILKHGIKEFENTQKQREQLLKKMLDEFNEGRSKSYYCIAATVFEIDELKKALIQAERESGGMNKKDKSKILHSILNTIALKKKHYLKLRKKM